MSFSHRVGVAANIAIIVTCAVLVTFVAVVARDRVASPPLPNPYQVGNVFAEVTPATQDTEALVVVFRTNCRPCRDSADFHRALTKRAVDSGRLRVVAVSAEPESIVSEYLRTHQIQVSSVLSIDRTQLRVRSTPTLFWLDASGTIRNMWIGRLSPEGEQEVLRTLSL